MFQSTGSSYTNIRHEKLKDRQEYLRGAKGSSVHRVSRNETHFDFQKGEWRHVLRVVSAPVLALQIVHTDKSIMWDENRGSPCYTMSVPKTHRRGLQFGKLTSLKYFSSASSMPSNHGLELLSVAYPVSMQSRRLQTGASSRNDLLRISSRFRGSWLLRVSLTCVKYNWDAISGRN